MGKDSENEHEVEGGYERRRICQKSLEHGRNMRKTITVMTLEVQRRSSSQGCLGALLFFLMVEI